MRVTAGGNSRQDTERDPEQDTGMELERSTEGISPDVVRTNARQPLSPVVVPMTATRYGVVGRPLHSKRATQKPYNKSYAACVILRAKHAIMIVRPIERPSILEQWQ